MTEKASRTTGSLPTETLGRLRAYQIGGKTVAEVIEQLMDEVPPPSFWERYERQLKTSNYEQLDGTADGLGK